MTEPADSAIEAFAREIGWTTDPRSDSIAEKGNLQLLDELKDLFGRPVHWSSDATGTISVESGEKWLVQFRTFVDAAIIWRTYERINAPSSGPRFKIARRNAELSWESVGYFTKWPPNWTSDPGGLLRRLVEVGQNLGKGRKKTDGIA